VIKDCGQSEKWMKESVKWQLNPSRDFPDLYICGSAIISDEERTPYMNHVEVMGPEDAQKKVQEYHDKGLMYIKLYSRLRMPEFRAAVKKARELDMNVCAHVEYNVPIDSALDLGVKHFEHLLTLQSSVLRTNEDWNDFITGFENHFKTHSFIPPTLEASHYINEHPVLKAKMDGIIDQMAAEKATLSTTIHVLASYVKRSYFRTYIETRLHTEEIPDTLNAEQDKQLNSDFDLMMGLLKQAHEKGVKITIGTDCKDGGKAMLSEMMLLHEAGFSTEDILQVATLNGANAMGLGNIYGSVSPGKKANLVIFEKNPLEDHRNFLASKTVIKDGLVYRHNPAARP
jgi:imidazolonepropionase-like amidohydrolase